MLGAAACPICAQGHPHDVVADLEHVWVTAPPEAPLPGYLCLVSKVHVREPFELSDEQREGFWRDVDAVALAVDRELAPRKINYEIHGNTIEHLHLHLFPRDPGDPFERRPIDPRVTVLRSLAQIERLRRTVGRLERAGVPSAVWPGDWAERRAGRDCLACAEGRPDEIPPGRRIFAGDVADAYLCRDEAARGYTLVFWRGRHVAEPTELSDQEAAAFWSELMAIARAIEVAFSPAKTNYLWLGNGMPHLHVHLVPRSFDDPDAGRPPRFMMVDRPWPLIPVDEYARLVGQLRTLLAHRDR